MCWHVLTDFSVLRRMESRVSDMVEGRVSLALVLYKMAPDQNMEKEMQTFR